MDPCIKLLHFEFPPLKEHTIMYGLFSPVVLEGFPLLFGFARFSEERFHAFVCTSCA